MLETKSKYYEQVVSGQMATGCKLFLYINQIND